MNDNSKLKSLQTSSTTRRLSLAKASLLAGSRWAKASASSIFDHPEEKERKRKQALSEQAQYLVKELGKLKGSIVKIGQMMALYGEHFLPEEVTQALHQLNNQTTALEWPIIQKHLEQELGEKIHQLEINPEPLGTASLAQVHRARRKSDGLELVLKIQYPNIAAAIDSDMNMLKNLLKITRLTPQTSEFDQWFEEIRQMLHREVDYGLEAETTQRFAYYLANDPRFIVPKVLTEFSTSQILCMTYEHGISINDQQLKTLPQNRRNKLAEAALEILIREILEWGEMQTDPNFGNYLIRISQSENQPDQIILLDFGAIRKFDQRLLNIAKKLILAGFHQDHQAMMQAMTDSGYSYFDLPFKAKSDMARVFLMATESFKHQGHSHLLPPESIQDGLYNWNKSQLHQRIMQYTKQSIISKDFSIPPKEFMFISRKFIGGYTFMTVLDAQTNVEKILQNYLPT